MRSAAVAAPALAPRRRFIAVLGGLTAVNLAINLLTLVSGPLQARLLGPQGRGELALVLVVAGLAPAIGLGLGWYLAREISRPGDRGVLLGTVAIVSALLGTIGALLAYPVSLLFASHGHVVQMLIFAGLLVLPISVVGQNLTGAYWGEERWRLHSAIRLIVPLVTVAGYLVLAIAGAFTVISAAVTAFAAGLLALAPLAPLLRGARRWTFDRVVARRALAFGSKSTVASLANQANLRVDQLFIASLVSVRELGFYVVGATLAGATLLVSQALNLIVVPMVAMGDHESVRRILRITLALMILASLVLAAAAGPLVALLFGDDFAPSVVPAQILCFGSVFVAGKGIVSSALVGHGRPGETAIVEVATLAVLVASMLVVVPAYGATGAALLVVVASAGGLGVLVLRTRTWLGGRLLEYLVPTAADVRWLTRAIRTRAAG